jgi:hypothetical protein
MSWNLKHFFTNVKYWIVCLRLWDFFLKFRQSFFRFLMLPSYRLDFIQSQYSKLPLWSNHPGSYPISSNNTSHNYTSLYFLNLTSSTNNTSHNYTSLYFLNLTSSTNNTLTIQTIINSKDWYWTNYYINMHSSSTHARL